MTATAATQNLKSGYAYIPKELYAKTDGARLPLSAAIVGAVVYSFSAGGKTCSRRYETLQRDLGLSRATVGRSLKALKRNGYISAVGKSEYVFENGKASGKLYLRADYSYFTTFFKFKNEPQPRRLTESEAHVLALLVTRCDNLKKNDKSCICSFQDIADELNISKKTAFLAVRSLISAKLVYRADKGVNGSLKSKFHVNARLLRRTKKAARAAAAEFTKAEQADERKRKYAVLRDRAERIAEQNLKKAKSDTEYKTAERELIKTMIEEANAEAFNLPSLADLRRKRAELQERRQNALKRLNLSEDDLLPQYHCCKCNDTGYTDSGQLCNCLEELN